MTTDYYWTNAEALDADQADKRRKELLEELAQSFWAQEGPYDEDGEEIIDHEELDRSIEEGIKELEENLGFPIPEPGPKVKDILKYKEDYILSWAMENYAMDFEDLETYSEEAVEFEKQYLAEHPDEPTPNN